MRLEPKNDSPDSCTGKLQDFTSLRLRSFCRWVWVFTSEGTSGSFTEWQSLKWWKLRYNSDKQWKKGITELSRYLKPTINTKQNKGITLEEMQSSALYFGEEQMWWKEKMILGRDEKQHRPCLVQSGLKLQNSEDVTTSSSFSPALIILYEKNCYLLLLSALGFPNIMPSPSKHGFHQRLTMRQLSLRVLAIAWKRLWSRTSAICGIMEKN